MSYDSGESATSDPVTVTFVGRPARPTGLVVTVATGSRDVSVDWDDVEGATDYLVRWRRHGPGQQLNDGVRPTASDARITVADYGRWVVQVKACNDAGCSEQVSSQFEVTASPTGAPANLELAASLTSLDVTATWDAAEGATHYRLGWRSVDGSGQTGGSTDVQSARATVTVAGSGWWDFHLTACDGDGCGDPVVRRVDVAPVTFTWTAPVSNALRSTVQGASTGAPLVDAGDNLPGPHAPTGTVTGGARRYAINWSPAAGGPQPTDNFYTVTHGKVGSGAASSFTLNVGSAGAPHTRIVQVGDTGSWQVCISRGALTAQPNRACATVTVFDFPTADAGADQQVETGETVTLRGGGSSTVPGASLSYAWTQTRRHDGDAEQCGGTEPDVHGAVVQGRPGVFAGGERRGQRQRAGYGAGGGASGAEPHVRSLRPSGPGGGESRLCGWRRCSDRHFQ